MDWGLNKLQISNASVLCQTDVAKVVETQANLERQLELIETHQDEVFYL